MGETKGQEFYFVGTWQLKPGREQEFRAVWTDFAQWTVDQKMGAQRATLVQDIQDPQLFYSIYAWESEESLRKWRETVRTKEFMMRIRAYCANCHPSLTKVVERTASDASRGA